MKKRYFKPKDKGLPKGYDSKLELRLHEGALRGTHHHVSKEDLLHYTVPHTYEVDFHFEYNGVYYLCEAKGRFVDTSAASKLNYVNKYLDRWNVYKNSNCNRVELFLIFENASTAFPFAKRRKDGSKLSHGEWATKNGFKWLCEKRGDLDDITSVADLIEKLEELN